MYEKILNILNANFKPEIFKISNQQNHYLKIILIVIWAIMMNQ